MDDADSRVGARFGPYELRALVGKGGMGEVYEAFDTVKGRVVAVKLLPADLARDPVFQQRFRYESQATARLAEPHVIPIHDWGEIDGVLYIDMRFVRGSDLRSVLREKGPLSPGRAVAIVEQIAAALDAAHAEGLVHRDVKPANILVTPSDFAYLADFGIARSTGDPNMTDTGAAVGSYNYIAPERLDAAPLAGTADVYSLTCVLYESLTGTQPFPAAAMSVLIRAHLTTPPPRPTAKRPGLPPALDDVVARGMAKDPADRYQTASALASAARAALTAPAPDTSGPRPPAPATVVFPSVDPPARRDPRTGPPPVRRGPGDGRPSARPSSGPPRPSGPLDRDARSAAPTVDLGVGSGDPGPGARPPESTPRPPGPGSGEPRAPGRPVGQDSGGARPPAGAVPPSNVPTVDLAALTARSGTDRPSAPTVDLGAVSGRPRDTPAREPGRGSQDAATVNLGAVPGPNAGTVNLGALPGPNAGPHPPDNRPGAPAHGRPSPRKQAQARIARPPGFVGPAPQGPPRPHSDEVAVTLQRSAVPQPAPAPPRRARTGWIVWSAAALLVLIAIVAVVGWRLRDRTEIVPPQPSGGVVLPEGARACTQTEPVTGRLTSSATGSRVTSCPFAEAVRTAYGETAGAAQAGDRHDVIATSPVNGREYTMHCETGAEYVTCTGGENAVVYLY